MTPPEQILVITGLSGAGKTRALRCFEDLGYFCVDNLIPPLLPQLILMALPRFGRLAVVMDIRGGAFFGELAGALEEAFDAGHPVKVLFLEAADEALVKRFSETRRRHPMTGLDTPLLLGIRAERERLVPIRAEADSIVDTTELSPRQLKEKLLSLFAQSDSQHDALQVTVQSFGYKFGAPLDADLVMDVRFLPNPHYDLNLRPFTGLNEPVRDFVLQHHVTQAFMTRYIDLLNFLLPHYRDEGKMHLTLAVGCTGGRHRSVAITHHLADYLKQLGYRVVESHRDIERHPGDYVVNQAPTPVEHAGLEPLP